MLNMQRHRISLVFVLSCLMLLASCGTTTASVVPTPASSAASAHYTSHIYVRGWWKPDDLAFDAAGRIWFSDGANGMLDRVNADGSVTVVLKGFKRPEGVAVLPDNTVVFADQVTNRIYALAPGATRAILLRQMPSMPAGKTCNAGINGIAFDPTTNTLIIPNSPTGVVYHLSLDGKIMTPIISGLRQPDSAVAASDGTIFVDEECGGAIWRIPHTGAITHMGGFGALDDIVIDPHGNLLVTDVSPTVHALIRVNWNTGRREILASKGYIKPEGLLVDAHGRIYLADDEVGEIVEYVPQS